MSEPFEKTTIFHSSLVKAGTIEVLVVSDVLPSKYKKPGTPNKFVELKIGGKKHQLTIETEEIANKLTGLKGHVVELTATGGKDDAELSVFDAAGPASEKTSQARSQQPPPQNGGGAPTTSTTDETLKFTKALLMRSVVARVLCHDAALLWAEKVTERHPDNHGNDQPVSDEDVRAVGSSLFIMLDKRGLIDTMPWKLPEKIEHKPEPPPKPAPPPREPEPDDDEIPF